MNLVERAVNYALSKDKDSPFTIMLRYGGELREFRVEWHEAKIVLIDMDTDRPTFIEEYAVTEAAVEWTG